MAVLNAFNLNMSFGESLLFKNVNFRIDERDKVGLVGSNGTGKTTLFKLITGELEPTGGQIVKSKAINLGYAQQHACEGSDRTLYGEMESVFEPLIKIEAELEILAQKIERNEGNLGELINRQSNLHDEFAREGGLTFRSRARSALLGLGFAEQDFDLPCSSLSGGQRSKLSLGKLLLSGSDLVLLDEPTNHLDISGIEWLESFLAEYKGAALIISHERYFLDKVTAKTMELVHHRLTQWKGNYSEYLEHKKIQTELIKRNYANQMGEIEHIKAIIEQQRRWGRERNFITAASKEKMLEKKLAELVKPESEEDVLGFDFKPLCESGNEVLTVRDISKAFDESRLFSGVSFRIMKNERVFLLGSNGCGKTTLLKILTKAIRADSGSFFLGANVKIGYYDQTLACLNKSKRVIDEIWDCHREMNQTQIRSALAAFLFKGEDVFKPISDLSGGEKARVALLKLMLSGANFLLLDEPTNHLDITSMEALEKALLGFEGTMLIVSHDRYFINKLSTKILSLSTEGVREFSGGYDDYFRSLITESPAAEEKKPAKVSDYKLRRGRASEIRKLEGRIRRCEQAVDELDKEKEKLSAQLSSPETADKYELLLELSEKIEELEGRQLQKMEEWEQLNRNLYELNEGEDA